MTHAAMTPAMKEYRLMYFFGTWITKEIYAAETPAEAIFDADMTFEESGLNNWRYGVALWDMEANRITKQYK